MLTPEDKQRIEEEERYRAEVRKSIAEDAPPIKVQVEERERKPSNGTAAVLSLFLPGAGQMYQGKTTTGLLWLVCVVIGYFMLIVPGLILHICCIANAAANGPLIQQQFRDYDNAVGKAARSERLKNIAFGPMFRRR